MPTVYEIVSVKQADVIVLIEKRWGKIKCNDRRDPEDNATFRFFDRLMRQKPRRSE